MRINKFLNDAGACSRREADRLIEAGRVKIAGRVAKLGDQVEAGERVSIDGEIIRPPKEKTIIAYHKPVGVIVTTDPNSPDNVMQDLLQSKKPLPNTRLFPVGRLDVSSSGLLLLTDDTSFADAVLRPTGGHEKEYEVQTTRDVDDEFLKKMSSGVMIIGRRTRQAKVTRLEADRFRIILTEGMNRQIRRMCETLGTGVRNLKRVRFMTVELGELLPGQWRKLSREEAATLRAKTGIVPKQSE
jgi:23S rRNA pseudouridine2604 synthase